MKNQGRVDVWIEQPGEKKRNYEKQDDSQQDCGGYHQPYCFPGDFLFLLFQRYIRRIEKAAYAQHHRLNDDDDSPQQWRFSHPARID